MMLLARVITQKFSTPTNNRLRTSSNTRNQAVIQDGQVDIQTKNACYGGNGNKNAGRQNRNQTFNAGTGNNESTDGNAETVISYDAKAVSEVNASSKVHEQVSHVKHKTIIQTSDDDQIDSNIIFNDPYVKHNGGTSDYDSNAHDEYHEIQMLAYNVQKEVENKKRLNNELKEQKMLLQKELETCKDQVKTFESKIIQCSKYKDTCEELERELKADKDTIERILKEKDKIQNDFFKVENEKLIIQHETQLAKKDFKEREDRYLDDIVDLEEKLSSHDRIVYKIGQSIQKIHMLGKKPNKVYDPFLKAGAKLKIGSPDSEETLDDAEESRLKMRNKMVQINCGKLNALYETFVHQQEFSVEQTYFSILSTSNNGSESKEKNELLKAELEKSSSDSKDIQANLLKRIKIIENDFKRSQAQSIDFELKLQHQKEKMACDVSWKSKLSTINDENVLLKTQVASVTYAYANVRAQNQDLLITISELKNKLHTVDKGKNANTKFDKSETSGTLLCVTPLPKNIAVKAKQVSNTKVNTDRIKSVTSHFTPKNEQSRKHNENVISRGMYRIIKTETQTPDSKINIHVSNSTGVESSNSVRRSKSKDTKSKNRVLKNTNDKSSTAHVRKMSSGESIDSNKRETMHSNVCQSNASVLSTKTVNAVNDGSNIVCVSCGKDVVLLSHEKCVARYALSKNSSVKRALFTTPIAAKSKNLGATSVVAKSRLSVAKTPTATTKVSSVLPLSPDSSQSRTLSNYMKNKIATSRKWQKWFEYQQSFNWTPKSKIAQSLPSETKSRIRVIQLVLWIVDSGCSKHMTGNLQLLRNFVEKFMGTIRFRNDHFTAITGYGDYFQGNLTICHVYYVEGLGHNLFLVGKFCDGDLEVAFRSNTCYVQNLESDDLLTGSRDSNLYTISISEMVASSPVCLMSRATSTKSWLWHRRLSHLNFDTINQLTSKDLVDGLSKFKYNKDHLCSACEQGKSKKASLPPKLVPSTESKLELLYIDLCGPMKVVSINGKKYILVIVDDYSLYTWVYFLHTKDEAPDMIIDFIYQVQMNLKAQILTIRTDNGTEFKNEKLRAFYAKLGIVHKTSIARRKPNIQYFHVFGSLCYPTNDRDDLGKMKPKADIGIFIGYSESSREFRIYNRGTKKIMEKIHVKFDELTTMASECNNSEPETNCTNFQDSSEDSQSVPSKTYLDNLFGPLYKEYYSTSSLEVSDNSAANTLDNENTSSSSSIVVEEDEAPQIVSSSAEQIANEPNSPVLNENVNDLVQEDIAEFDGNMYYNAPQTPMFEEAESSSTYHDPSNMHEFHQKHRSSDKWTKNHLIEQVIVSTIEPKNIKEAMLDHRWIESMQDELNQFKRLDVWELVECPIGGNIIAVKWIWKNKTDAENTVIRNKSRLVAKGYGQEEGINFEDHLHQLQVSKLSESLWHMRLTRTFLFTKWTSKRHF
ncbi:retrovirus-related pol polyprotein from transposon TNT 1-94 [Tanacetum coccineum]